VVRGNRKVLPCPSGSIRGDPWTHRMVVSDDFASGRAHYTTSSENLTKPLCTIGRRLEPRGDPSCMRTCDTLLSIGCDWGLSCVCVRQESLRRHHTPDLGFPTTAPSRHQASALPSAPRTRPTIGIRAGESNRARWRARLPHLAGRTWRILSTHRDTEGARANPWNKKSAARKLLFRGVLIPNR
jgi:hypothetical protein